VFPVRHDEVFLAQVADDAALLVANDGGNRDQVDAGPERRLCLDRVGLCFSLQTTETPRTAIATATLTATIRRIRTGPGAAGALPTDTASILINVFVMVPRQAGGAMVRCSPVAHPPHHARRSTEPCLCCCVQDAHRGSVGLSVNGRDAVPNRAWLAGTQRGCLSVSRLGEAVCCAEVPGRAGSVETCGRRSRVRSRSLAGSPPSRRSGVGPDNRVRHTQSIGRASAALEAPGALETEELL